MPTQEEQNLDILSTLHYVMGVITFLLASIPIIHLVIGIVIIASGLHGEEQVPQILGWIFVILASILIVGGWIFAVLIIFAGRRLKERRSYNFCLVISFLECLIIPLGTVLGIFTIINLTKESVKALFEGGQVK